MASPRHYSLQGGIISWKGRTIYQIVSRLRRVTNANSAVPLYFLPPPVTKGYRRETSLGSVSCHSRLSQTIAHTDEIPGGSTSSVSALGNGVVGYIDPTFSTNRSLNYDDCTKGSNLSADRCTTTSTATDNVCFRPDIQARRRCRSAGMIPRKFIGSDHAYFPDNKQYLHSRNRTIQQNGYIYIRQGASNATPGTVSAKDNIYSPSGLSHCPKYTISAALQNNTIEYIWIDGTTHTVEWADGEYDIFDFNNAFANAQMANQHYFVNTANNVKTILLHFGYSTLYGVITLQTVAYMEASGNPASAWTPTQNTPQVVVGSSLLGPRGLGFASGGTFPSVATATITLYGQAGALLAPSYVKLYYKPSNPQFATQGGVSSSSLLLRTKYNEIQKTASQTAILGQAIANSLAYDVPTPDYATNIKAKMGYPMTQTPTIRVYDDGRGINKCKKHIYR